MFVVQTLQKIVKKIIKYLYTVFVFSQRVDFGFKEQKDLFPSYLLISFHQKLEVYFKR